MMTETKLEEQRMTIDELGDNRLVTMAYLDPVWETHQVALALESLNLDEDAEDVSWKLLEEDELVYTAPEDFSDVLFLALLNDGELWQSDSLNEGEYIKCLMTYSGYSDEQIDEIFGVPDQDSN